ncbi:MAG TPA: CooT family nickel-binding protein [Dehalococcoidia bacterium]|nr:CooT family nickel-binding protein [Dehalococcoidia bacterium]
MCLATAYLSKGSDESILRDIAHMRFDGERVEMETLFGEEKFVSGRVLEVYFSTSKIILEQHHTLLLKVAPTKAMKPK